MARSAWYWWTLDVLSPSWLDQCATPGVSRHWMSWQSTVKLSGNCIGTIMLAVDGISPVEDDVLVMDSSLWGFNMLIGMDIINMLGGVRINQSGDAIFSKMEACACTVIRIEEPDFSAEFDEWTRAWTALWKWSGNEPPDGLTNKVTEYPISTQVWQEYRHELEMWLNNGWLLPYPEELNPP